MENITPLTKEFDEAALEEQRERIAEIFRTDAEVDTKYVEASTYKADMNELYDDMTDVCKMVNRLTKIFEDKAKKDKKKFSKIMAILLIFVIAIINIPLFVYAVITAAKVGTCVSMSVFFIAALAAAGLINSMKPSWL